MAFQAVPDAAECVIKYLGNSVNTHNVVHATKLGGYNLADLVALAVAVDLAVSTSWLPRQSLDWSYVNTTVRGLAFLNDQETVNNTGAGVGGDLTGGLPNNVTFSVKRTSGLTGRNARGRLYWVGIPRDQIQADENKMIITDADAIVTAIDALRVGITGTAWTAAIVSRFLDSVERPTGVTFEWKQTSYANINIDSQRRRLL